MSKTIDGTDPADPTQAEIVALIDGADITPNEVAANRVEATGSILSLTDAAPVLNPGSRVATNTVASSPALQFDVDSTGNGIADKSYAFLASETDTSFQLYDRLTLQPIWNYDPVTKITDFDARVSAIFGRFNQSVFVGDFYSFGNPSSNPLHEIRSLGGNPSDGVLITSKNGTFGGVRFGPTDQGCFPEIDNKKFLGGASFRWTAVYAVNGTIQTSAEKEKKNVRDVDKAAARSFVSALKPKKYKYKEDQDTDPDRYGFIAEEVKALCDDQGFSFRGLHEDADGNLGICYSDFVPLLIEQVQELRAEIDALKKPK